MQALYDAYPCKPEDIIMKENEETYEIPGYDGARISKTAPLGKLLVSRYENVKTLTEMLERGCSISENDHCLGWQISKSKYSWISYKEFKNKAIHFGSGLINFGINLSQTCNVGIYSQNSVEWLTTQFGCYYYSSAVVPLYDTIGPDAGSFIINNAETQVVVCDQEKRVKSLLDKSDDTPLLKYLIHVEDVSEEIKYLAKKKGITLKRFSDIEELGKDCPIPTKPAEPMDVAVICFTSGTTGNPKGALLTHRNFISGCGSLLEKMGDLAVCKKDVLLSYLPLAHTYELTAQTTFFMTGASIGFFSGDISKLTDDMKMLRPTIFTSVPRILNKLHDKVEAQIKNLKTSFEKDKDENANISINSQIEDKVHKLFKESLGGRIRLIVSAAAPIAERILNFYQHTLGWEVMEVYGQTECSAPACVNMGIRGTKGSVGVPVICNMIKLEDVPELGYFKKNKIGEICIKGANVFKGYLKDSEKTAEALDEDGWLHTGDVGTWLTNGTLKIVDRKKNIFKLSQGEYIMPEEIENICMLSSYVSQILVHGNSLQSFLVAIVVPEKNEVLSWCDKNSIVGTWNDICKNPAVKQLIVEDMQRMVKNAGIPSFKQVKDVYLHPEQLTSENGHLTPTHKTKRHIVEKHFMNEIKEMYK